MTIWKTPATIDELRKKSRGVMAECVGLEYLDIGDDFEDDPGRAKK